MLYAAYVRAQARVIELIQEETALVPTCPNDLLALARLSIKFAVKDWLIGEVLQLNEPTTSLPVIRDTSGSTWRYNVTERIFEVKSGDSGYEPGDPEKFVIGRYLITVDA
jgi:hypothetical protein